MAPGSLGGAPRAVLASFVLLGACSSGHPMPPMRDGGLADADAEMPIGRAVPPALPVFTPCPPGWVEESVDDLTHCEPFPSGMRDCTGGEAQFPGDADCVAVGRPCPPGDFPEEGALPDGALLFVRPGAMSGDGSRARPFGTIAEATNRAVSGTTIELARGDYAEVVTLPAGTALEGACAAETVLRSDEPTSVGGVVNARAGTALRHVRIADSRRAGVWVQGERVSLEMEGVVIEDVTIAGVEVFEGGALTARDLVVRRTRPRESDAIYGRGLNVEVGAQAEVTRALFEANRDHGIFVQMDSSLDISDVVVRDTESRQSDGSLGRALGVQDASEATVQRAAFVRSRDIAVHVALGGTLDLEHVVVRETRPRAADSTTGRALNVQEGASMTGRRILVEENRELGYAALDPNTVLVLEDVIARDTIPRESDDTLGRGFAIQLSADATVRRAAVEGSSEVGVAVSGEAVLDVEDLRVRGTATQASDRSFGRGVSVQLDSQVSGARIWLEENHETAFFVNNAETRVAVSDLTILRTRDGSVPGGTGRALSAQGGAQVTVVGGHFEANREVTVMSVHPDTTLSLETVDIVDTLERGCGGLVCDPGGMGGAAFLGGTLRLRDFAIRGSALCGVVVADEGDVYLEDGAIEDNPIGVCVQTEGYDVSRLMNAVAYDNEINLDATQYTLPSLFDSL